MYGCYVFTTRKHPAARHGVVAFLLEPGDSSDNYSEDLFGPFGFSSAISTQVDGETVSLYARNSWGTVQDYQLADNPELQELKQQFPHHTIVLAGVRRLGMFTIPPLHKAENFVLVRI